MYDSVIKLVKLSKSVDSYGDIVETETVRTVFCEVKSIGMSEFYQANANGFKPTIKFVIADFLDYQGEERLRYKGFGETNEKLYSIIRTYRKDNLLEIVCDGGVHASS